MCAQIRTQPGASFVREACVFTVFLLEFFLPGRSQCYPKPMVLMRQLQRRDGMEVFHFFLKHRTVVSEDALFQLRIMRGVKLETPFTLISC